MASPQLVFEQIAAMMERRPGRTRNAIPPLFAPCRWRDCATIPPFEPETPEGPANHVRYRIRVWPHMGHTAWALRACHARNRQRAEQYLRGEPRRGPTGKSP